MPILAIFLRRTKTTSMLNPVDRFSGAENKMKWVYALCCAYPQYMAETCETVYCEVMLGN